MMEPKVVNLGWANGWNKEPEIVTKCKTLKHKPTETSEGPPFRKFTHTVRCDICGYVYKYDSS